MKHVSIILIAKSEFGEIITFNKVITVTARTKEIDLDNIKQPDNSDFENQIQEALDALIQRKVNYSAQTRMQLDVISITHQIF